LLDNETYQNEFDLYSIKFVIIKKALLQF